MNLALYSDYSDWRGHQSFPTPAEVDPIGQPSPFHMLVQSRLGVRSCLRLCEFEWSCELRRGLLTVALREVNHATLLSQGLERVEDNLATE